MCPTSLFFSVTCLFLWGFFFFGNHFEELQTVLFEGELISNNAPFIYVYPDTIEKYLILNHLSFDRQLLYSSNTTSIDNINRISNHFWDK